MRRSLTLALGLLAVTLVVGQGCPTTPPAELPVTAPSTSSSSSSSSVVPPVAAPTVDLVAEPKLIPDHPASQQQLIYRLKPDHSTSVWTASQCVNLESLVDPLGEPDPQELVASCLRAPQGGDYAHFSLFWFPVAILPQRVEEVRLNLFCIATAHNETQLVMEFLEEEFVWPETGDPWKAWCREATAMRVDGLWLWNDDVISNAWVAPNITDEYRHWVGESSAKPNYGLAFCNRWSNDWAKFASSDAAVPEAQRPFLAIRYQPLIPRELTFPLVGNYSPERVSGYRFGEWWEKQNCPNSKDTKLWHTGTDFGASAGDKVYAALTGQIKLARTDPAWGGYVVLEHHDGNLIYTTTYTHVTPLAGLTVGHWLTQGLPLGTVASISSPHLHFQIRLKPYDEQWSLAGRLPGVSCLVTEERGFEPAWPNGNINSELVDYR